jgi:hypothetical protein
MTVQAAAIVLPAPSERRRCRYCISELMRLMLKMGHWASVDEVGVYSAFETWGARPSDYLAVAEELLAIGKATLVRAPDRRVYLFGERPKLPPPFPEQAEVDLVGDQDMKTAKLVKARTILSVSNQWERATIARCQDGEKPYSFDDSALLEEIERAEKASDVSGVYRVLGVWKDRWAACLAGKVPADDSFLIQVPIAMSFQRFLDEQPGPSTCFACGAWFTVET